MKAYVKPEVELVTLTVEENVTDQNLDGSTGTGNSPFSLELDKI